MSGQFLKGSFYGVRCVANVIDRDIGELSNATIVAAGEVKVVFDSDTSGHGLPLHVQRPALCSGWPFHPAGYLVSGSFGLMRLSLPIFVTWALKSVLLRYGGLGAHRRAQPVGEGGGHAGPRSNTV